MALEAPAGTEVLRVESSEAISELSQWVHDGYLEDGIRFSAASARAVIPFVQERRQRPLHASMAGPELIKSTPLARHYDVPLTRCYIVIEQAETLAVETDSGDPLLGADFSDSTFRVSSAYFGDVSVRVTDLEIRLLVTSATPARLHRRVLRGLRVECNRWIDHP